MFEQHKTVAIEPTDPQERALAIRICRANAYLDPDTGLPHEPAASLEQWRAIKDALPFAKWIWMWRHGRDEWDMRRDAQALAVK